MWLGCPSAWRRFQSRGAIRAAAKIVMAHSSFKMEPWALRVTAWGLAIILGTLQLSGTKAQTQGKNE